MKLTLTTPTGTVLDTDATYANLPGDMGDFGVLPGHINLVSTLRDGSTLTVKTADGKALAYTVKGGFAEVKTEGLTQTKITILTETAEQA
ncbi:MAG: F0F1 ATP synthase subunit epsilon [Alphaproteobacteria bacterium CG_4_10_14_0_8_um_filter_53_9]|nr:MAG: F0F1 ATP synthase subunit epsilon [Alphaproteobacteria bacterium CG_4_10_14_0_8_um_filter_53_9]